MRLNDYLQHCRRTGDTRPYMAIIEEWVNTETKVPLESMKKFESELASIKRNFMLDAMKRANTPLLSRFKSWIKNYAR